MSFRNRTGFLLAAVLGVSGCMFTIDDADWSSAAVDRPAYDQSSEATRVAETACREALAGRLGLPISDTRVDYVLEAEAGLGVWMSARGLGAQWICQSDAAGNVAGLGEAPVP